MDEGMTYIKLYRKVAENELFLELPYDRWHAFEYLLLHARRFPSVVILKGKPIPLDTGQLIIGEGKLGTKWGWSRGKVIRFLDMLEELEMIKKNGTPYGTVITIENYAKYQCDVPSDDTPTSTPVDTPDGTSGGTYKKNDKKVKKEKKEKKDNNISKSAYGENGNVLLTDDEFQKIVDAFPHDWNDRINNLSWYIASKGDKYKSHYATILSWARKDGLKKQTQQSYDPIADFMKGETNDQRGIW